MTYQESCLKKNKIAIYYSAFAWTDRQCCTLYGVPPDQQ